MEIATEEREIVIEKIDEKKEIELREQEERERSTRDGSRGQREV